MIAIHPTANLADRHRRQVAVLVATACPSTAEWPRYVVTAGVSLDDLQSSRFAVWWIGDGESEQLLRSGLFRTYRRDGLPNVILARSYPDARSIADALGRERAA